MMKAIRNLVMILTLKCGDASKLTSDENDRKLRFSERVALRLHNINCYSCRHFRKQLAVIRKAAQYFGANHERDELAAESLPNDLKQRLRQFVDRQQGSK